MNRFGVGIGGPQDVRSDPDHTPSVGHPAGQNLLLHHTSMPASQRALRGRSRCPLPCGAPAHGRSPDGPPRRRATVAVDAARSRNRLVDAVDQGRAARPVHGTGARRRCGGPPDHRAPDQRAGPGGVVGRPHRGHGPGVGERRPGRRARRRGRPGRGCATTRAGGPRPGPPGAPTGKVVERHRISRRCRLAGGPDRRSGVGRRVREPPRSRLHGLQAVLAPPA